MGSRIQPGFSWVGQVWYLWYPTGEEQKVMELASNGAITPN
jgi:hypothetical protein